MFGPVTWRRNLFLSKEAIANATHLVHYDPNKELIIETDASLKGLGCVMIQDQKPVRFLSKSLTGAEQNYSNIERELLGVLFACEKLHTYTFGRSITVHTDHRPLEAIFKKPVSLAPTRLQRMLHRLSKYDINIKYVGSKGVLLADTLSRLITPGKGPEVPGLDVNIAQILSIKPSRLESLQEETKEDITLKYLQQLIITGWPESMQDVPIQVQPYWCFRDELVVLDGLIMKGNRVIIPASLQEDTLKRLHEGHQGQTAMLRRARRTVFWPKIQDHITEMTGKCPECNIHANKKIRVPERQISTTRPLEVLGIDLMEFNKKHVLVSIDYFSGYIFYDELENETSKTVTKALTNNFRKFWPAERIISDNGPCFKSDEFRDFCNSYEIKHTTSSPHFHESNGRVERAIQTVKRMQRKTKSEKEFTFALMAYHDTPISDMLPSPSELLFSKRTNARLIPAHNSAMLNDQQKKDLRERRSAHLKKSSIEEDFSPNQPVWFTEDGASEWKPGYIDSKDIQPQSYWIVNQSNNRRRRRNIHDIKKRLPIAAQQQNENLARYEPGTVVPPMPDSLNEDMPIQDQNDGYSEMTVPDVQNPITKISSPAMQSPKKTVKQQKSPMTKPVKSRGTENTQSSLNVPKCSVTTTRSGRTVNLNKDPDFVYQ